VRERPRYRVLSHGRDHCTLRVLVDCALGERGEDLAFSRRGHWVVDGDGRQVCSRLERYGDTLMAGSDLADTIRREVREAFRYAEKEWQ